MVRPREWDREELRLSLIKYTAETDIPIVAEFCYRNEIRRDYLYEMPELTDAVKACIHKKEVALERKALMGDVNCTMAIFSLKQLGWKDTHEQTHKGDKLAPIVISQTDSNL